MIWAFIVWWVAGTATFIWLYRGNPITWLRLLASIAFGWFGMFIWIILGFTMLVQADFWTQPVFPQKEREE